MCVCVSIFTHVRVLPYIYCVCYREYLHIIKYIDSCACSLTLVCLPVFGMCICVDVWTVHHFVSIHWWKCMYASIGHCMAMYVCTLSWNYKHTRTVRCFFHLVCRITTLMSISLRKPACLVSACAFLYVRGERTGRQCYFQYKVGHPLPVSHPVHRIWVLWWWWVLAEGGRRTSRPHARCREGIVYHGKCVLDNLWFSGSQWKKSIARTNLGCLSLPLVLTRKRKSTSQTEMEMKRNPSI